jgi:hypothetical protein
LRLYCRQKMFQHHINKEICIISVVFPLFCPTSAPTEYKGIKIYTAKINLTL